VEELGLLGPIEPIARASIADQVFDLLHQQVLSLALPPGTKLSEAEVARQLNVSRQPVRDAFYRLSKLGFLLIQPQKATQVSQIHIQDIRKARFIRTAIEVEVMRRAVLNLTEADFQTLDANLAAQQEAVQQDDRARFHRLDDEFHTLLCNGAGVGFVWNVIRENKAHTDRVRFLSLASGSARAMQEHHRILTALRNRDEAAAVTELRAHLGQIETIIEDLRKSNRNWFSEEGSSK
jgi:GntR family transcriptional regulator, rspAB operon transcriptional repressor